MQNPKLNPNFKKILVNKPLPNESINLRHKLRFLNQKPKTSK